MGRKWAKMCFTSRQEEEAQQAPSGALCSSPRSPSPRQHAADSSCNPSILGDRWCSTSSRCALSAARTAAQITNPALLIPCNIPKYLTIAWLRITGCKPLHKARQGQFHPALAANIAAADVPQHQHLSPGMPRAPTSAGTQGPGPTRPSKVPPGDGAVLTHAGTGSDAQPQWPCCPTPAAASESPFAGRSPGSPCWHHAMPGAASEASTHGPLRPRSALGSPKCPESSGAVPQLRAPQHRCICPRCPAGNEGCSAPGTPGRLPEAAPASGENGDGRQGEGKEGQVAPRDCRRGGADPGEPGRRRGSHHHGTSRLTAGNAAASLLKPFSKGVPEQNPRDAHGDMQPVPHSLTSAPQQQPSAPPTGRQPARGRGLIQYRSVILVYL